uniref:N-alpha-acetyltransferase 20 n=1 Tax=Phallusia mammillata TaxID=59560 RepID=A0A6F9DL48_9ASCI|nr:N-alpha-acetyltransferase 20-like [Phallusia mammillata]
MTLYRPFTCQDMLRFNRVNLDPLTETYAIGFYLQYLAKWPEYFMVAEAPTGEMMGYIMGKVEGRTSENWHGHVTALSVSGEYRRLHLAASLMSKLEEVSEKKRAIFVDLYVRKSNQVAFKMYKKLGYVIYRTVLDYYSSANEDSNEDAYDMRKATVWDINKTSTIPEKAVITPDEIAP